MVRVRATAWKSDFEHVGRGQRRCERSSRASSPAGEVDSAPRATTLPGRRAPRPSRPRNASDTGVRSRTCHHRAATGSESRRAISTAASAWPTVVSIEAIGLSSALTACRRSREDHLGSTGVRSIAARNRAHFGRIPGRACRYFWVAGKAQYEGANLSCRRRGLDALADDCYAEARGANSKPKGC
jgi:hypothetical protein